MDFSILGNYSVILGGVSSVFVAILVIFVTHYLRRLYCETTATTNNVSKEFSNKDQAKSEEEILNNLGYSQERLSEIAKYAQILHEYEPPEEIGAGEPSKFNKKQEDGTSGKIFPGIAKYEDLINEADSVNDCDSLTVNLPDEDDQDDIDISDIISDDISIDEDLEDDVDGQISPQAMADIEAEMLDDSILNESFEDQTKPDAVKQNDKDQLEDAALYAASSALSMALGELGMESLIQSLKLEDNYEETGKESSDHVIVEVGIGEGGNVESEQNEELLKNEMHCGDGVASAKKFSGDLDKEFCDQVETLDRVYETEGEDQTLKKAVKATVITPSNWAIASETDTATGSSLDSSINSNETIVIDEFSPKKSNDVPSSGLDFTELEQISNRSENIELDNLTTVKLDSTEMVKQPPYPVPPLNSDIIILVQECSSDDESYEGGGDERGESTRDEGVIDRLKVADTHSSPVINIKRPPFKSQEKTDVPFISTSPDRFFDETRCDTIPEEVVLLEKQTSAAVEEPTCSRLSDTDEDLARRQAVDLVVSYLVRRAVIEASSELYDRDHSNDEEPLAKDEDKNVKLTLTEEEIATEKKAQENQLSEIFALMEKNPEMFGMTTKEDIQRQAGLYRQFKSKAPKTP